MVNYILKKFGVVKNDNIQKKAITYIRQTIQDSKFIALHKINSHSFTRMRKLSFTKTLLLIFQKSIKSIQIRLNEYTLGMGLPYTISNSSFCQAQKKLKHTAFKELNDTIVSMCYEDSMEKRYKGYRLLGVDGSKIILPDTQDVKKDFGKTYISMGPDIPKKEYASLLFECCYDVLNHICVYSEIHPGNTYEVTAAKSLLKKNPRSSTLRKFAFCHSPAQGRIFFQSIDV